MLRTLFILFLFTFPLSLFSQYSVEGKVTDGKEPLAFVNIGIAGTNTTTSSDIDGKFRLTSSEPILGVIFTYVGYESYKYSTEGNNDHVVIKMKKAAYDLNIVTVKPGENPAHRIIKLASKNRDQNNPEKVESYTCSTYSKTYWDLVYNEDEIKSKSDSAKIDSLKSQLRLFSENSHLLMMETVTERKFLYPENLNEKVVATKVSGFKDPSFTTTATDLQPFQFYDDYFKILGKDFLNPLTSGSTVKYYFQLEDTLFQGKDSVYIISFRPLKGKNFTALEGILYINTNGYAVQNVIAEPYEKTLVDIKIQQQYKLVDGVHWFPEQLNYELHYKKYPTKYYGMKLIGKSYIKDVRFDNDLRKRDFNFESMTLEPGATRKDDSYWNQHRADTLDAREKKTYRVIDSLGRKTHFDRVQRLFEALTTLQIPFGPLSLDVNRVLGFNDYEVARGGVGLHTNDRFSPMGNFGGYIAYGYADSITKYGFDCKIYLKKGSKEHWFRWSYSKDLAEPGKTQYFYPWLNFKRNQMTYRMDYVEQFDGTLHFRTFKWLTADLSWNESSRIPKYDYIYLPDRSDQTKTSIDFKSTELRLKGRYAYKEKLIQSFGQLLSDGSKYPVVYFGIVQAVRTPATGYYDYTKASVGIEKDVLVKNLGRTHLLLEGGWMKGDAPYPYLFNGNGSSIKKDSYLYIENTFQTMGLYEFLSDRYANIFFSHNFGSLLFKRPKFQPQLEIFSSAGWGSLAHPEQHTNLDFKTMEKGFYESGMMINNIVRVNYYNVVYLGFGGGAFMRYGPYADPHTEKNMAYKLSLVLTF
ncbi:MAG: DUF5686 family protein [Bacteroidia bacterium]